MKDKVTKVSVAAEKTSDTILITKDAFAIFSPPFELIALYKISGECFKSFFQSGGAFLS